MIEARVRVISAADGMAWVSASVAVRATAAAGR